MRTFYLPALGYSDTETHRWLTVRLYERFDGVYMHGVAVGLHVGAWRRMQLSTSENEVRAHHFALLRLTTQPALSGNLVLVTACPDCGTVQEHLLERGTYAVQCPGCRRIWLTEELLYKGSVEGHIGEIDNKLSAAMVRLATLQGYTVRASD
jgi:ribosomal protein S27E